MVKTVFAGIDGISAWFTDRHGGISSTPYDSLNLGIKTGDDIDCVLKNRTLLFNHLNIDEQQVAYASQVHGNNVEVVEHPGTFAKTDALVTRINRQPLVIQVADCACVYLADPVGKAVGLIHSGWRGTASNIIGETIQMMQSRFQTDPAHLEAWVSPCIGATAYDVGEDVFDQFDDRYFTPDKPSKWRFDMKSVLRDQLIDAGLKRVQLDEHCTFSDHRKYFSHRRDGRESGRMFGIIMLNF